MVAFVLTVHTRLHTYAVLHTEELQLRLLPVGAGLPSRDQRNRPLVDADLGSLLDAQDVAQSRRCAIVVPLRRRSVALLCDTVSDLREADPDTLVALPVLFVHRLPHEWIAGVYVPADTPILLLNLRQIALDVLRRTAQGDSAP